MEDQLTSSSTLPSVSLEELMEDQDELDLLLFTKEEEEFMVVPTWEDSPIRLEDLLSEANFNGLTVDLLQNPSGVFVVDVDQTSSNHNSVGNNAPIAPIVNGQNFVDYNNQEQHQQLQYSQQQFSYGSTSGNNDYKLFNHVQHQQQVDNMGFFQSSSLTGSQFSQPQYTELTDPTANWVAQSTDVGLLERILDIVPSQSIDQSQSNNFQSQHLSSSSPFLDKKQILEEIYREAEEISSRRESPAILTPDHLQNQNQSIIDNRSEIDDLWEEITNSSSTSADSDTNSSDSYSMTYQREKKSAVFDHSFINLKKEKSKSNKKNGDEDKKASKKSSSTEKAPKREVAKQKKKHQNREAALRYRLKKRAEKVATSEELGSLMERNEYLKTQKSNLASEISYLKGLLTEVNRMKKIRN